MKRKVKPHLRNHSASSWAISRRDEQIAKDLAESDALMLAREKALAQLEQDKLDSAAECRRLREQYAQHQRMERSHERKQSTPFEQPRPLKSENSHYL